MPTPHGRTRRESDPTPPFASAWPPPRGFAPRPPARSWRWRGSRRPISETAFPKARCRTDRSRWRRGCTPRGGTWGRRKRKKKKKETYLVKRMRDSSRRGTSYTTHTLTHVHTYCAEHCQAAISIASRRCSSASLLRTFWPWRNQVHGTGHLQPPSPFPLMVARTECTRAARARQERSKSEEGRRT